MRFFLDENISVHAAKMLEAFDRDNEIRAHRDFFEPGLPDAEWLSAAANWSPRPVIVCGDGRILRNRAELQVLKGTQTSFVLLAKGWTNASWQDFAWKIIKAWPAIVSAVSEIRRPSVIEVSFGSLKVEISRALADL